MGRYSSDSDSQTERKRSNKKSKRKSKGRRRSRSSSYDTGRSHDSRRRSRSGSRGRSRSSERRRRSKSRDDRRRRHRSRSEDSYRSRRSHRRSRSKSRSPRRRRSRSRSDSRDDRYSRRRSRSRSAERSSSKRNKKSKKRSRSREYSSKQEKTPKEKPKDPCESIPGFAEMTPAEQSKLRIQAAFDAVEASTVKAMEAITSTKAESTLDQIERSQVLQDIEDDDFIPTHFSSSRSAKTTEAPPKSLSAWPKSFAEQEDYHEMAIFGSTKALALDEKVRKEISDAAEPLIKTRIKWEDRDPETLAHESLKITKEEAELRWVAKLNEMRRKHLIEIGVIKS